MGASHVFATDVFRIVCERLQSKASELRLLAETASSFEEWLAWEAFLACKLRQASYPFCEVAEKPSYASEGVVNEGGNPDRNFGDLRVGGPNDGAHHCWVFAEFVLVHDSNRTSEEWRRKIDDDIAKLLRLGWKMSASILVVVAASRSDVLSEWSDDLARLAIWNQPALTDPFVITFPSGGSVVLKAFDIKQDSAHVLSATAN